MQEIFRQFVQVANRKNGYFSILVFLRCDYFVLCFIFVLYTFQWQFFSSVIIYVNIATLIFFYNQNVMFTARGQAKSIYVYAHIKI